MSKSPRDQLNEARLTITSLRIEVKRLEEALASATKVMMRSAAECAIDDLEKSGNWYFIAKGRTRQGEPLYAVQVIQPKINGAEYRIIEDEEIQMAAGRALAVARRNGK